MRNADIKVGLFICVSILLFAHTAKSVSAMEPMLAKNPYEYVELVQAPKIPTPKPTVKTNEIETKEEPVKTQPHTLQHIVQPGDSLSKIAEQHNINWTKIFDKNISLDDPNSITPGQVLDIPTVDEELTARPLPATEAPVSESTRTVSPRSGSSQTPRTYQSFSSAGNTYAPGYCTWYAKNRRPDLPNRMGNASSWVSSAAAAGFGTGNTPEVGAIGQQGNHVVYVEAVHGNGTVTVSEMNYSGLYVVSSRTVAASNFMYIYWKN